MAYRYYALFILLFVYVHCLLSRFLPAFLASVPVPGCSSQCDGVATMPLCGKQDGWPLPSGVDHTAFSRCQECRRNAVGHSGSWFNLRDGACVQDWQYGLLMSYGFVLPYALCSLVAGYMTSVVADRRLLLGAALAAWSGATMSQARATSFLELFCWRLVLGGAQAFAIPAAQSLASDHFDARSRGMVNGVLAAGLCIGAGAASWAVPLSQKLGWRAVTFLTGIAGLMLVILLTCTVSEPRKLAKEEGEKSIQSCTRGRVSRVGVPSEEFNGVAKQLVAWLTLACSFKMAGAYIIAVYLPTYYLRMNLPGYTVQSYATANSIIVVSMGLFASLLGGFMADWYGGRFNGAGAAVIVAATTLLAAPLFAGIWLANSFYTSLMFFALTLAVSEGWLALTMAQLSRTLQPSLAPQAIAVLLGVATLVSNAGPAIVGMLDTGTGAALRYLLLCSVPALNVCAAIGFAIATSLAHTAGECGESVTSSSDDEDDEQTPLFSGGLPPAVMRARSMPAFKFGQKAKTVHFAALGHADVSFSMAAQASMALTQSLREAREVSSTRPRRTVSI